MLVKSQNIIFYTDISCPNNGRHYGGHYFVINTPLIPAGEVGKSRPGAAYRDQCWVAISCSYIPYRLDIVCIELQFPFHTLIPCPSNGRQIRGLSLSSTLHLMQLEREANQDQEQHIETNVGCQFPAVTQLICLILSV